MASAIQSGATRVRGGFLSAPRPPILTGRAVGRHERVLVQDGGAAAVGGEEGARRGGGAGAGGRRRRGAHPRVAPRRRTRYVVYVVTAMVVGVAVSKWRI